MTVAEIKKHPNYQFECNITDEAFKKIEELFDGDFDEWGVGFCWFNDDWFNDDIGIEYNLCLEDGENYSAIYRSVITEDGYLSADYDDYIPYKIDFTDKDWKAKFEDAMCKALIAFFHL